MRKMSARLWLIILVLVLVSCSKQSTPLPNTTPPISQTKPSQPQLSGDDESLVAEIANRHTGEMPRQWGEKVSGVLTYIYTGEKVMALTFDACGGPTGSGYDQDLIGFLMKENIPATLFLNARWIDANPLAFQSLAANRLFLIANHGFEHRPLSVSGRSVYGISGTVDAAQAAREVLLNKQKIASATGSVPTYFRSGTAYYDEVAVQVASETGAKVIGFNLLGDAGATYPRDRIRLEALKATAGTIAIYHMNHPERETAEGLMLAIPALKQRGFRFVKLDEFDELLR